MKPVWESSEGVPMRVPLALSSGLPSEHPAQTGLTSAGLAAASFTNPRLSMVRYLPVVGSRVVGSRSVGPGNPWDEGIPHPCGCPCGHVARFGYGVYQIGDENARAWIAAGQVIRGRPPL